MKLIAHIGAPKTATTQIQAILRENTDSIEAAGYLYVGPRQIRKTDYWKRIFAFYRNRASLDDIADIGQMLPEADRVLLSEEGITHDLMPRGGADRGAGGFARVEQSATILEQMGAERVHVVLAIRRQDRFIASTYTHQIHHQGLSLSPEHWFAQTVDPAQLSWASVIEVFERRFGAENLTIVPFERAREDFAGYLAAVLAPTGIDPKGWTWRSEALNPSLSLKGIEMARAVNALAGTEHRRRRAVINAVIREFPATEFGSFRLEGAGIAAELAQRYDAENRALGARWFPDHADALGFEP